MPVALPLYPRHVYLAGPSGFTTPGATWHNEVLIPAVAAKGLVGLDPWAGNDGIGKILEAMPYGTERRDALAAENLRVGRANFGLVDQSAAILAVLDGTDVDSGTALEIGYGFSRGLVIVGLRTDIRNCGDNDGSAVNLMIETCIVDSGGIYTTDLAAALEHLDAMLPHAR